MKPCKLLVAIALFLLIQINSLAQNAKSFSIVKTGSGKQNIIFIPGYSCSGKVWDETLQTISKNYTCHVITFSGFAGEKPQANPILATWVSDLATYIKEEKISKPIVIGHSLGGGIAAWLAADYPSLLSKIIIVDALPSLSAFYNPSFVAQQTLDCSPFVKQFTAMNDEQFYAMQKTNMPMLLSNASKLETVIGWSVKSDRNTLAQIYCQFLNTDLRSKLSSVTCEALVMLEPSFKQNDAGIQEQYKLLANKTIKYASKGLHFIMYDDQEWFLNELKQFLIK
ncbi:MAG: alpha/beta fold hydrolase [Cyclobacteriaceae bacterium]